MLHKNYIHATFACACYVITVQRKAAPALGSKEACCHIEKNDHAKQQTSRNQSMVIDKANYLAILFDKMSCIHVSNNTTYLA